MWWQTQQKPDFVFRRNGRFNLNRPGGGGQYSRLLAARGVRISGSNVGYIVFRGSVKGTGYPLHSPVSPFTSTPVCHRVPLHFNWSLSPFIVTSHRVYLRVLYNILTTISLCSESTFYLTTFVFLTITAFLTFRRLMSNYSGRTAPLTSKVSCYIFVQQI